MGQYFDYGVVSAGTSSNPVSSLVFSNSNGLSFGLSLGTITGSHNALTSQSTAPSAISAGTTFASSGTVVFSNSNGVTFGLNGNTVTASFSGGGAGDGVNIIAAGTQTANTTGTVVFSNSNGVTFGMSNNSIVTASHNGLTSQSNQALSAANGSFTFQTATFADSNGISFSTGTQGIYGTVKTDYLTSQSNQALSGANGSFTFQTATFADSNGVSWSTGTQGMYATVKTDYLTSQSTAPSAISAGTTSASSGTIVFSNSNGHTFGMNGNTVTISGGDNVTLSQLQWPPGHAFVQGAYSNATFSVVPFWVQQNVSGTVADLMFSCTAQTSTNNTMRGTISLSLGIYSLTGNTLSSMSSASQTFQWSQTSNGSSSVYNGVKRFTIPLTVNMTPGNYYYGVWARTSNGGTSQGSLGFSVMAGGSTSVFSGLWGAAVNGTVGPIAGLGILSASTAAWRASIALTDLNASLAAGGRPLWVNFRGIGLN